MKSLRNVVVVREYARLTTGPVEASLDQATVSQSAFDWLCKLASGFTRGGATLLQVQNRKWLRWDSYVGVIETPCGTVIEVLPKHCDALADVTTDTARGLLTKMLSVALELPARVAQQAQLTAFRMPLPEWIMKQFVTDLDYLVKRGLRSDYLRQEEEQRFLRGQLDVARQMRQGPARAHFFNIRHDVFMFDRPENRLLKSAVLRVCHSTRDPDTWRLAHELASLMAEVPESRMIDADFRRWSDDRLMAHYRSVRPWCELVLGEHMPVALKGETRGISMLFPMERLFERYVEIKLRSALPPAYKLKAQARSKYLCEHEGEQMFQLRPDFVLTRKNETVLVLDAKWKLISQQQGNNKYGLAQADFYQAYAYGEHYLDGAGQVVLIYPATELFYQALPKFSFSDTLQLRVMPFDLEKDALLVPQGWEMPC